MQNRLIQRHIHTTESVGIGTHMHLIHATLILTDDSAPGTKLCARLLHDKGVENMSVSFLSHTVARSTMKQQFPLYP